MVQATPLADACPDIFINSVIRGSICGCHRDVLILDAPCPVGCEGGVVMKSFYSEGHTLQLKNSFYAPIAMVIVPVLLKASSLTGLGLAVDLGVVRQAVMDAICLQGKGGVKSLNGMVFRHVCVIFTVCICTCFPVGMWKCM